MYMNQRELIVLLERQIQVQQGTISDLKAMINSLKEEIKSLKEALLSKGKSLETQKAVSKGLSKILKNESERQKPEEPQKTEAFNFSPAMPIPISLPSAIITTLLKLEFVSFLTLNPRKQRNRSRNGDAF